MISQEILLNAAVLLVDDQAANLSLLEQMLQQAGYRNVTATTNPMTVCDLHRAHRYDLIVLDLQMPGMDGFEVMEGLKTIERESYLSVLVITAQPGHKLRALQAGAKDFVSKPFDLVEVTTRIHNLLEVRLLYKELEQYSQALERTVAERTAALRESEARYRRLTELAADWHWEQDAHGTFTQVSGPVFEMLGILPNPLDPLAGPDDTVPVGRRARWNLAEQANLQGLVAARQPFLDFYISRVNADGTTQRFRVSGEPIFDESGRFLGYRGVGAESPESALEITVVERAD